IISLEDFCIGSSSVVFSFSSGNISSESSIINSSIKSSSGSASFSFNDLKRKNKQIVNPITKPVNNIINICQYCLILFLISSIDFTYLPPIYIISHNIEISRLNFTVFLIWTLLFNSHEVYENKKTLTYQIQCVNALVFLFG